MIRISNGQWMALSALCLLSFILLASSPGYAQLDHDRVAQLVSLQGTVLVKRAGTGQWKPARRSSVFAPGDMIRLKKYSRASVRLANRSLLRLDQNTIITFSARKEDRPLLIKLVRGIVHFFSTFPQEMVVSTPFVNGGVEGTEFLVHVTRDRSVLTVLDGRVRASNPDGSLLLERGQSAVAFEGRGPVRKKILRPRDAVNWALYYPPVVTYPQEEFAGRDDWKAVARRSLDHFRHGRLAEALVHLEKIPETVVDPKVSVYRAALLLTAGRTEEARVAIERALSIDPSHGPALAVRSVMALTQGKKAEAMRWSQKGLRLDPSSLSARIALSYAQQAHFRISEALDTLRDAVDRDPANALVLARYAELLMAVGDVEQARERALQAVALRSRLARTQTVLGFVHLANFEIPASVKAFQRAIDLDQTAPLPRLGLGLARIHDSEVQQGRAEIEIAASLDPNSSLIRSYLGKAYYEEKRNRVAGEQLAAAKQLDPADPTPWLYDAIRKQSLNRPVEALSDIKKSIELNDNRALYRSRLLLDQDLAVRSAGQARIFQDLGFERLALVEGWNSVTTDPSEFSAHRFLSDLYSGLPRHEIARASELLQAQLLQPRNITPVSPQDIPSVANPLGERSGLQVLEGTGPAAPGYNEFSSLFARNRFSVQVDAVAGEKDTLGETVVHSGVQNSFSYSLGQHHYETDGFRPNNFLNDNIYDIFTQLSLDHGTSLQGELRVIDREKGDLPLRFDPDNFSDDLNQKDEILTPRIGIHHAFEPDSHLLASLIYQKADYTFRDSVRQRDQQVEFTGDTAIDHEEEGYLSEIQYRHSWPSAHLITGAGHYDAHRETSITTKATIRYLPPLPPLIEQQAPDTHDLDEDIGHTNLHAYSLLTFPEDFTWTLGLSSDFLDGIVEREQINPKLGAMWRPTSTTTLRAAAFRVLKRSLLSDQTLEPTQVAGFNQFFDEGEGTRWWRYGLGLDQQLGSSVYTGVEWSRRDLEVPYVLTQGPDSEVEYVGWDEEVRRAYAYWTPLSWLGLSVDYAFEHLDRDPDFPGELELAEVKTHKITLGGNTFFSQGLFSRLEARYIDQEGTFELPEYEVPLGEDQVLFSGQDSFWVLDASCGYRIPQGHGHIVLGGRNITNNSFRYQDTDPDHFTIAPERLLYITFNLTF